MSERDLPRCATCADLELLTYTQAGKVLGFSRWTIRAMVRAGQLRVVPRGSFHRIPMFELRRWERESLVNVNTPVKLAALQRAAARRPS